MLDHVGIIHMGGRIFDPAIGRFLSADPVVKGMGSTEAYNRYSYVGNNPMSYTDPTGYFSLGLGIGGRIKREFSRVESRYRNEIRGIVTGGLEPIARYGGRELAKFIQRNKYGGQILGLVTIAGCSVASAGTATAGCIAAVQGISTSSMAYGTGESIEHALRAGTRAAAIAMADSMVSGAIGGVTEGLHPLRAATVGAGLHGMRGATFAAINGYDIRSGLIGGATEGALGGAISRFTVESKTGQMAIAAMVSGTVSEVSGGDFATGAVTGAMGYLFNQLGQRRDAGVHEEPSVVGFIREEGVNVLMQTGQAVGGAGQVLLGGALCYASLGLGCTAGAVIGMKGIDNFQAGIRGADSASLGLLVGITGSENMGTLINAGLDMGTSIGGLLRSVPKISAYGTPYNARWYRGVPGYFEPAYRQATTTGLTVQGATSATTVIDTLD